MSLPESVRERAVTCNRCEAARLVVVPREEGHGMESVHRVALWCPRCGEPVESGGDR